MSHQQKPKRHRAVEKSFDQNVLQHNSPLNQNYLKRMDIWEDAGSPIKHRKFKCMDLVTSNQKNPTNLVANQPRQMMDLDYDIVKQKWVSEDPITTILQQIYGFEDLEYVLVRH